jgi:hypothetical protein
MSKYFDFDILNQKAAEFMAGNPGTHGKYFDFHKLVEREDYLNSWLLFFIISLLIYLWVRMFAAYDRT